MAIQSSVDIKARVLAAFDTLFNKRDYARAAEFWSESYIQHSAHIPPGRDGLFNLVRSAPPNCAMRITPSRWMAIVCFYMDGLREMAALAPGLRVMW
jgi:predicted SnoaL-like aldol condensation-catalyzing enzyme